MVRNHRPLTFNEAQLGKLLRYIDCTQLDQEKFNGSHLYL